MHGRAQTFRQGGKWLAMLGIQESIEIFRPGSVTGGGEG